jgi:hypothetical protein
MVPREVREAAGEMGPMRKLAAPLDETLADPDVGVVLCAASTARGTRGKVETVAGREARGKGLFHTHDGMGRETVKVYRRRRGDTGVVPPGVQMPTPDGPQAMPLLREIDPHVLVAFMAGFAGNDPASS